MLDDDILNIYPDGSSYGHPRRGGVGFRFIFPEKCSKDPEQFSPFGYKGASNNQMELQSCILALKQARKILKSTKCFKKIIIHTDCEYVSGNYKKAKYEWSSNKGTRRSGAPVANYKLWKELVSNMRGIYRDNYIKVEIEWTRGHSKDIDNKIADKLAKKSAKKATLSPLIPTIARRKKSPNMVEHGSVKMLNQKVSIRVITALGFTSKKDYKYKYEIISRKSEFYQCVDIVYSKKVLRPTHKYFVKMNDNQDYPQITKVIKERGINS